MRNLPYTIAIYVVLLASFCGADETSEKITSRWIEQSEFSQPTGYLLTYVDETDLKNPVTQTEWFSPDAQFTQGDFMQNGEPVSRVYVTNPKYTATIQKKGNSQWVILELGLSGTGNYKNLAADNSCSRVPYWLGIVSPTRLHEFAKNATWDSVSRTMKFEFPKSTTDKNRGNDIPWTRAEFVVSSDTEGLVPVSIKDLSSNGTEEYQNQKTFSNWKRVGDQVPIYSELTWVNTNLTTGKATTFAHNSLKSAVEDPLAEQRCWLAFYGLPEPAIGSPLSRLFILVILAIGGIFGLLYLQNRRRTT